MKLFDVFAGRAATWFTTPVAIIGVPVLSVAWFVVALPGDGLTNILSVLAITMASLVLVAQNRDSRALHAKLDELMAVTDGARDELERVEDKQVDEIEDLRRGEGSD